MSANTNNADVKTMMRFYDEVLSRGKVELIDELTSPAFKEHEIVDPFPPTREGTKQWFQAMRTAFPDLKVTVNDIMAAGDKVVARVAFSGTHKGEFMNMPPTNKKVEIQGIDIIRFSGGKAVEHWGIFDNLKMLQQLGVVPEM